MSLLIYPDLSEGGPENMGTDWWLFSNASPAQMPKFRVYSWKSDEISFGYGQKWEWVEKVTGLPISNLMRRPTGGGIVRHGRDWTYCLTLPRVHSSFTIPSLRLYELIHEAIGHALIKQDVPTSLQPCPSCKPSGIPGDCFEEPVGKDLMTENGKVKLAGAAMKKSKKAVLVQGTIDLSSIPSFDKKSFKKDLIGGLSDIVEEKAETVEWPESFLSERDTFAGEFGSLEWRRERKRV